MGRKKKPKKKQKSSTKRPNAVAAAESGKEPKKAAAASATLQTHAQPSRDKSQPPASPQGKGTDRSSRSRFVAFMLVLFFVIVVPAFWFVVIREDRNSASNLSAGLADTVAYEDFAGAETCEECHETQYEAWLTSTHGKAGGNPSRDLIIARFDGRPIRFADAIVLPIVAEDSSYQFVVEQEGFEPVIMTVSGVIGGGHMYGGGTQGFVSEFPDGTVRFLPFDFIRREDVWFCNTNSRSNRGWIPITMDVSLTECADWPPVRLLGTDESYANCQECHAALVDLEFDSTANRYSTRITTLAIDCESCHGPMADHVARSQPDSIAENSDIAVEPLATFTKDESLNVCFRCHALKSVLEQGFLPGKPLADYYSVGLTMLGGGPFYPDGRVRTFAYQGNHRYSDCYLNGSMTCVDCHDPHSQTYRDIWGRALDDRFADEQCTDCHASKAEHPEEHTFHEPGTEGSRCVDCHMPYLQHPELGNHLRFARSDHTIPIPRPGSDDRMGVVNACAQAQCHADSSTAALERVTRQWYGELKPHKPIVASLLNPQRLDENKATSVLLDSAAAFPAVQVNAIGVFATRFLRPNMAQLDADVSEALWELSRSSDLDVKATALAALYLARGQDDATHDSLIGALEDAEADGAPIRSRWATVLGTFGDHYFELGEWDSAITCYTKATEINANMPAVLMNMGLAQAYAQNHEAAVVSLRRSIELDRRQPLAWVNLGFSLESLGDTVAAERAYRTALSISETEAVGHFNLANILFRRGDLDQAIDHYRRTIALQPTLAQAHLSLLRALMEKEDLQGSLAEARLWLRYFPNDARPRQFILDFDPTIRRR